VKRRSNPKPHFAVLGLLGVVCLCCFGAAAQEAGETLGENRMEGARSAIDSENISTSLSIVFLITIISLAPAILVMTTSFTRIIVVLGFLRQALATQQTPPNQVLVGLALFLTGFIMWPTYQEVNANAIQPYMNQEIGQEEALQEAVKPIREFMFRQTRPEELKLFLDISGRSRPERPEDVPTHVLIPAFIISELAIAFEIGFIIYIPFLIIDMVVASTLMAMGMMAIVVPEVKTISFADSALRNCRIRSREASSSSSTRAPK